MRSEAANGLLGSMATLHQRRLGTLGALPAELFRAGEWMAGGRVGGRVGGWAGCEWVRRVRVGG